MFFDTRSCESAALRDLHPQALAPLADWFAAVGAMLRAEADRRQRIAERHAVAAAEQAARRAVLEGVPAMMATYLSNGMSEHGAVQATVAASGLEEPLIRQQLPLARRMLKARHRGRRNRRIMKLRARGLSNPEIAAAVGLTPQYVAQIISEEVRAARDGSP